MHVYTKLHARFTHKIMHNCMQLYVHTKLSVNFNLQVTISTLPADPDHYQKGESENLNTTSVKCEWHMMSAIIKKCCLSGSFSGY